MQRRATDERINAVTGAISKEKRYYISSALESAKYSLIATKSHWELKINYTGN